MKGRVGERFSEFFEKWICQLDEYLQLLLKASEQRVINTVCDQREIQTLVSKVTQHYKDYFTIKWCLAHEDVLAFFCPIWCSPLENAYSWFTGWKPSTIFKLIHSTGINRVPGPSLAELTQEQLGKDRGAEGEDKVRGREGGEGNGEATGSCGGQEDV
ncbi:hypothetical protein OIU85_027526 [Salix viminalis]|uniref:DOG1 domain-containing protein n=1 Tax=Salix viminalis TaxID=40686 RepID=A0A9Q0QI89_SALVM|nr:hypothetical protein OIU85_027526 [Salix viminalis]